MYDFQQKKNNTPDWQWGTVSQRKTPRQRRIDLLMTLIQKLLVLCAFVFFLSYVQMATAGVDHEMEQVSQGTLFYRSAHDGQFRTAPMLQTEVDMRVSAIVNRVHLTQTFNNGSNDWVEGVYIFPLPENAAVDHMRIRIGERIIEGKIKERAEAKKTYEKAKQQGKRASLLEQERPNIFTTSVANIGPGEKVNIEIEYQQVLQYDAGKFRLRFPMAMTPRYIPEKSRETTTSHSNTFSQPTDEVKDADRITPLVALDKKINPVSIRIELDAGFPLEEVISSYHQIVTFNHGPGRYTINLADGEVPADRDFELVWKPVAGESPRVSMFREKAGDDYYYLVMMLPPRQPEHQDTVLAREVVYVIDTSGSMGGVSIRQARKALLLALKRLGPNDYFNVIEFNSTTQSLFDEAQPATVLNVSRARGFVANLNARGGTEMMSAMQKALKSRQDTSRLRQVIFLTDGAIGNEDALFEYIRHHLGNSRLFTVGIGSAPNSHFMSKAAAFGRGSFTYIGNVAEVQQKMQGLFAKLETPVMQDLEISHSLPVFENWPSTLPDLYAGEPLIITARSTASQGKVTLSGSDQSYEWVVDLVLDDSNEGNGIGKLWAGKKIGVLLDSIHDGADREQVREDVIDIALSHHLVSKFTSLVAVDITPVRPADMALTQKTLPTSLPHGQVAGKIFGIQAKTGTQQYQLLLAGILCLLLGMAVIFYYNGRGAACAD